MTDGPFQPTPVSAVPEEVQPSSMRQLYADWLSQTIAERFYPANSDKYFGRTLDFFGNKVTYDEFDGGHIEELVGNAYREFVPLELRPDFRGAVVDVLSNRLSELEPKLDEIKSLVSVSGGSVISPEAVVPIAEALIGNEAIRSDPVLETWLYHIAFELNSQKWVLDHKEDAYTALEGLVDSPKFDEGRIYLAVAALIRNNPESAPDVLMKYADRIKAFKNDQISSTDYPEDFLRADSIELIRFLERNSIELTPEQLAILQV